jgi:hypothetical protein
MVGKTLHTCPSVIEGGIKLFCLFHRSLRLFQIKVMGGGTLLLLLLLLYFFFFSFFNVLDCNFSF